LARIRPYLEIESYSRDHVVQVAALEHQPTAENTTKIYARYGINLPAMPILTFTPS
jgi:adenylate cyclase class 2